MTWQITVSGHQGSRPFGSDEHKRDEEELARKAREFVSTLSDHDVTQARFGGNIVNEDLLAPRAE
jgi:hypothetical protein